MSNEVDEHQPEEVKPHRGYFSSHWHGDHSLAKSFWINNWLLSIVIAAVLVYWLFVSVDTLSPIYFSRTALLILFISYFVIYPWQIIGLWRSSNRYIQEKNKTFWPRIVKFTVIIGLFGSIAGEIKDIEWHKVLVHDAFVLSKQHNYDVSIDDNIMILNGDLDYGISDQVEKLVNQNPGVKTIVLNSDGGLLYEASQLSKTILLNSLNTYTNDGCSSACTIAYISGNKRFIHEKSYLGFHKYSYAHPKLKLSDLDLFEDQNEDAAFFRKRGVSKEFTNKMYQADSEDMWYPSISELQDHGVVHKVIED